MPRSPLLPAAVLLAMALSGCVDPAVPGPLEPLGQPSDDAGSTPTTTPEAPATGDLAVTVLAPDRTPIPGVLVGVANRTNVTGADGLARFAQLPAGAHEVTATKEGWRAARLGVDVVAGTVTYAEAKLATTEVAAASAEDPHNQVYEFAGYFDCSATYLIITGDCFLVFDYLANQTGLPVRPGASTNERNFFEFPLDLGWTSLVVEMAWEPSTPLVFQGMTLALEPAEAPADGHAAKYARAHGGSPLVLRLDAGVKHDTATLDDMPNPHGGEVIRARAFVMGEAHKPAGTDFLGVGAAAGQRFTVYVSVFYDAPAPEGYAVTGGS